MKEMNTFHHDDAFVCRCGSEWFEMRKPQGAPEHVVAGVIALDAGGHITAWAGELVCAECRRDATPGQPQPDDFENVIPLRRATWKVDK